MTIYVPVYDKGTRSYEIIDTEKAIYRKLYGYDASVATYGTIYNGENLYSDPEGVRLYWAKEYTKARTYKVKADTCEWKLYKVV